MARKASAGRIPASPLDGHYYNKFRPEGELGELAHEQRRIGLSNVLGRLKKLAPKEASNLDLFEIVNVLLAAGASQAYLATRIGVGKATINRWSNRMSAPQPIVREIAITRSREILEELLAKAETMTSKVTKTKTRIV